MSRDSALTNLTHHFLIAMPGVEEEPFARSVIYLCEHNARGALGLVINKPSDIKLQKLFEKVDLPLLREDLVDDPVLQGGPVQTERGFVLHEPVRAASDSQADPPSDEAVYASTLVIPGGGLEMTTSRDVLEALATGAGPKRVLVTLGYAAWGEGQLESEIAENNWLTVDASIDVLFDTPIDQRYTRALELLGMAPWMLMREAGHA